MKINVLNFTSGEFYNEEELEILNFIFKRPSLVDKSCDDAIKCITYSLPKVNFDTILKVYQNWKRGYIISGHHSPYAKKHKNYKYSALTIRCTYEFKDKVKAIAKQKGYSNSSEYIRKLVEKDNERNKNKKQDSSS